MTGSISVMIVDDHAQLRETLRDRLDAESGMEVVGTVSNAGDAIERAQDLRPDVVLMDIDMPGQSSFEAAKALKRSTPSTSIIFLSAFFHDRYIESALAAQASGYVTKDESPDVIIKAIRYAASEVAYFSPKVHPPIPLLRVG